MSHPYLRCGWAETWGGGDALALLSFYPMVNEITIISIE